jgi:hypothetical protein
MSMKLGLRMVKDWLLKILGGSPARIFYIGGSDVLPPPLDRQAEDAAVRAMEGGSEDAKKTAYRA